MARSLAKNEKPEQKEQLGTIHRLHDTDEEKTICTMISSMTSSNLRHDNENSLSYDNNERSTYSSVQIKEEKVEKKSELRNTNSGSVPNNSEVSDQSYYYYYNYYQLT